MRRTLVRGFLTIALSLPAALVGQAPALSQAAPEGGAVERRSRLQGSASLGRNRHVVGATVLVTRADETSRLFVTASDSKGRFRVDDLPDGDYRVEVRREGLVPVVKENIGLRFPSRAVIEVTMRPFDAATRPPLPLPAARALEAAGRIAVHGRVVERGGEPIPDIVLRFVRADGAADPVVVRSGDDGSFELPPLPEGAWRLETRVVGFLPLWASMELREDTELSVSMVRQPAGYDPSPLELMPPEQPIPPRQALAPPSPPADEPDEVGEATVEDAPQPEQDPDAPDPLGS